MNEAIYRIDPDVLVVDFDGLIFNVGPVLRDLIDQGILIEQETD